MKKAALELSVGFIVMLILGIMLFGFGLAFLYGIFNQADPLLKWAISDSMELEIENCLQRQDRVCVPGTKLSIPVGKTDYYAVVINNIYGEEKQFKVYVTYNSGILKGGSDAPFQDASKWTLTESMAYNLGNNKHELVKMHMKVPQGTKPGQYMFNINVCFNADDKPDAKCPLTHKSLYNPTQVILVEVP